MQISLHEHLTKRLYTQIVGDGGYVGIGNVEDYLHYAWTKKWEVPLEYNMGLRFDAFLEVSVS